MDAYMYFSYIGAKAMENGMDEKAEYYFRKARMLAYKFRAEIFGAVAELTTGTLHILCDESCLVNMDYLSCHEEDVEYITIEVIK